MLKDRRLVFKNVRGCRLQAGIVFGSNPRTASSWINPATAPPKIIIISTIKCVNTLQGEGLSNAISKQSENFASYGWKEAS